MKAIRLLPLAALLLLFSLAQGTAQADGPFTPTYSMTADEVAPGDPDVLPADDECPVGAACKLLHWTEIPDGQPGGDLSGVLPSSIVGLASDALVPDGAIVGSGSGSWRIGPVASCATEGTITSWNATFHEATTDPSTTTGSQGDLCSFSNWPTQLDGVRDDFLAANPGAVLSARWLACSEIVLNNVLLFTQPDGTVLYTVPGGDPTVPPTGKPCGPMTTRVIFLGITADNPETPEDEGGIPLLTCTAAGTQTFRVFSDRDDTPPGDPVVLEDTITCSPNTPTGSDVSVPLNGGTDALAGIDVTFSDVTSGGSTTVITTTTGPPPPTGFKIVGLAELPLYFDINTDASYSGDVTACVHYDQTQVQGPESDLKLMRRVGDTYVDVTTSVDTVNDIICGTTTGFSIFIVVQPLPVGGIVDLRGGAADLSAQQSDTAAPYPIALASGLAAAAFAMAAGAWYARRRWVR